MANQQDHQEQGQDPHSSSEQPPITTPSSSSTSCSFFSSCWCCHKFSTVKESIITIVIDKAFDVCDASGDGSISEAELYAGLLFVHLKLAKYAGPVACFPPSRRDCTDYYFKQADKNNSGSIDKNEFTAILSTLCGKLISRMILFWLILILFVPLLASYLISLIPGIHGKNWIVFCKSVISVATVFGLMPILFNYIDVYSTTTHSTPTPSSPAITTATTTTNTTTSVIGLSSSNSSSDIRNRKSGDKGGDSSGGDGDGDGVDDLTSLLHQQRSR